MKPDPKKRRDIQPVAVSTPEGQGIVFAETEHMRLISTGMCKWRWVRFPDGREVAFPPTALARVMDGGEA